MHLVLPQATPSQQAELQKIRVLHDKLSLELNALAQKMAGLQGHESQYNGVAGAKSEVQAKPCMICYVTDRDLTVQRHCMSC